MLIRLLTLHARLDKAKKHKARIVEKAGDLIYAKILLQKKQHNGTESAQALQQMENQHALQAATLQERVAQFEVELKELLQHARVDLKSALVALRDAAKEC